MNEHTLLAVLQALPSAIDTPLVIFETPVQAQNWIQVNEIEEDNFWILTNNERQYWVIAREACQQLISIGFKHIKSIHLPIPQQSSAAHEDGKA